MRHGPQRFIEGLIFGILEYNTLFFFLEKEMSDYTEKVDSYMMKDEAH